MIVDKLTLTERTTAKLLVNLTYVSVRLVTNHSVYLTQSSARTYLRKLCAMGWLEEKRVPSLGNCYFPTDIGRMGFGALVDEPLRQEDRHA